MAVMPQYHFKLKKVTVYQSITLDPVAFVCREEFLIGVNAGSSCTVFPFMQIYKGLWSICGT